MLELFEYDESNVKKQTRQEIIEKAMNLFILNGIHTVTMRDVANAANISLRTLYYYYNTKESLAEEIQIIAMNALKNEMETFELNHQLSAYENLSNLLRFYYQKIIENHKLIKYITAFDYYFYNDYPSSKYNSFLNKIKNDSTINQIFLQAAEDGSINFEKEDAHTLFTTIFQSLLAYAQKIIYREKAMLSEDVSGKGDLQLFINIMIQGLKKR